MRLKLKKDKYKLARGKYSRVLSLHCRVCKEYILTYQKDGSGNIRRIYLDRIFAPNELTHLQNKTINKIKNLNCSKCDEAIGTPYIYKKENRKAFKIYQDSMIKKIKKK